jgi:uncharacterized membrane protein
MLNYDYKSNNLTLRKWRIFTSLLVLCATAIRLINLEGESIWIDEAYSIVLANHSIKEIIQGSIADQHPPLYYVLLKLWLRGDSSLYTARLFSVFLGVFLVFQSIVFTRKLLGDIASLEVGLLTTLSPALVWYSQEARMYILLTVFTMGSMYFFIEMIAGRKTTYIYSVLTILAIYTHYFAIFILLSQVFGIAILWLSKEIEKKSFQDFVKACFLIIIAFLPWFPIMIYQSQNHPLLWIEPVNFQVFSDTLLRLTFSSGILLLPHPLRYTIFFVYIVTVLFIHKTNKNIHFLIVLLWALFPIITVFAISFVNPIFQHKQFIMLIYPLLLIYVWVSYSLNLRGIKHLMISGLILVSSTYLIFQQSINTKDNWRELAYYLNQNALSSDGIFCNPAASKLPLQFYLEKRYEVTGYPFNYSILNGGWDGERISLNSIEEIMKDEVFMKNRVWVVEFFPQFWDPEYLIVKSLNKNCELTDEKRYGNISLRLYEGCSINNGY